MPIQEGGRTPWGEFQDFSRGILVRSCKISKSNAMPLVRLSLVFQHNSWANGCRFASPIVILHIRFCPNKMAGTKVQVPCVHPTAVRLLTWTFVIYHAAMKTLAFVSPAIYFPSFTYRFGRHSFPHSSLYRIFGPTPSYIVEPGSEWKLGRVGNVLWKV
jgi:hypothetical protein